MEGLRRVIFHQGDKSPKSLIFHMQRKSAGGKLCHAQLETPSTGPDGNPFCRCALLAVLWNLGLQKIQL